MTVHLDREALAEAEVVIDAGPPATVRVPDVAVVRAGFPDDQCRVTGADVLVAVEVLSPGTRRTDRVTKLPDYAQAGIAHYVVVDPGPTSPDTALERP